MPFRPFFDCLWCGRPPTTREPDDLEGWAQLCPDCLGRAGDNGFLRFRLHRALAERAAGARSPADVGAVTGSGPGGAVAPGPGAVALPGTRAEPVPERSAARPPVAAGPTPDDEEDWLLRRGRFAHGPIHDAAWAAELDAAGRWLDDLPVAGRIVELGAGSGWWSPLLATRGELTVLDPRPAALDRTRERLVAHGLRAHLHEADPWSAAGDTPADAALVAFRLGGLEPGMLSGRLEAVRARLRPGGVLATIDPLAEPRSAGVDGSPGPAAALATGALELALREAGFSATQVSTTGRFFVLGRATA